MNDVIRLDELGVCAVGLCSNRASNQQIELLERFATQVADRRLLLFPDADQEGEEGFKELLWNLSKRKLSLSVFDIGDISQPEELSEWPA